jgi:hypothetical protein
MEKTERYNYVFDQYDGDSFIYDSKEGERIDDLSQCAHILNKYEAKLAVADDCADRYWKQLGILEKEETKRMEDFEKRCQEYYNSDEYKRDFAIAELEEVRSKIARLDVSPDESNRLIPALDNYTNGFHKSRFKIVNILDQQIKSLKGEK